MIKTTSHSLVRVLDLPRCPGAVTISAVRRCMAVSLTGVTGKHVPVTTLTAREPGLEPDPVATLLPFAMEILVLGVPLT